MKTYLTLNAYVKNLHNSFVRKSFFVLFASFVSFSAFAQTPAELVFQNSTLKSGTAGQDGAVYRFANVTANIDAFVKIVDRSDSKVKLESVDLTNTGWDKAWQPQVTYNNGTAPRSAEWWMEFEISFWDTKNNKAATIKSFDLSGLDIDGNGDRIKEYISFYKQKSYTTERGTLLQASNCWLDILGINTAGKRFDAPLKNYDGINPTATDVMVTNKYENVNTFRVRTGAVSTGQSGASDRMYALWFKSFTYENPVTIILPVVLTAFDARLEAKKVVLNWTSTQEKNFSHYVVEKSSNGADFNDVAIVFANGGETLSTNYSFNDVNTASKGVVYYRLKMVDIDKNVKYSATRIIRFGEEKEQLSIVTYPNPVTTELRITIPSSWQNKTVSFDIYNANGQMVKRVLSTKAGQTQVMMVNDIANGIYVVKASNGAETATQRIVKSSK